MTLCSGTVVVSSVIVGGIGPNVSGTSGDWYNAGMLWRTLLDNILLQTDDPTRRKTVADTAAGHDRGLMELERREMFVCDQAQISILDLGLVH